MIGVMVIMMIVRVSVRNFTNKRVARNAAAAKGTVEASMKASGINPGSSKTD